MADDEIRHHTERVPAALDGERIDRLVAMAAEVSRSEAVRLIAEGSVTVNGRVPDKPSERLAEDDEVAITVAVVDTAPRPDPSIPLSVVHEDDSVVVIDKSPDLVVHPGSGVVDGTLVNALLARYPELAGVGPEQRPGIVHRLDKGTSGLLMVARTTHALESLSAQLAARTVTRRYLALVTGWVEADTGLIDAPLGRSTRQATLRAVVADGRPARTRYRVIERLGDEGDGAATLVECRLETGRTHQIRVHMAAIDHPVSGDGRYGAPERHIGLSRPFLHAAELGFRHPVSDAQLAFHSPLPTDLATVLDRLSGR